VSFRGFLFSQRLLDGRDSSCGRVFEERSLSGEAKAPSTVGPGDFDKQLGRAELSEPESDARRRRVLAMLEVVGLHESPDHRPVLVALPLLGSDEVGQGHEVAREPENPSGRVIVVWRAHRVGNGATPRIRDMTSTRM